MSRGSEKLTCVVQTENSTAVWHLSSNCKTTHFVGNTLTISFLFFLKTDSCRRVDTQCKSRAVHKLLISQSSQTVVWLCSHADTVVWHGWILELDLQLAALNHTVTVVTFSLLTCMSHYKSASFPETQPVRENQILTLQHKSWYCVTTQNHVLMLLFQSLTD